MSERQKMPPYARQQAHRELDNLLDLWDQGWDDVFSQVGWSSTSTHAELNPEQEPSGKVEIALRNREQAIL